MQTNCIVGNVEMASTISPYKTSKELLTFVMVTRGDWLWKAANINYRNNGAVVYVGSSLKLHNPLFSFGKLRQNKLMQTFLLVNTIKTMGMLLNVVHFQGYKNI